VKRVLVIFLLSLTAMLVAGMSTVLSAQTIDVQGTVFNTADRDELGKPKPYDMVMIYIFETEAEGRKAARLWAEAKKMDDAMPGSFYFNALDVSEDATERNMEGDGGSYLVHDVSPEGALLFGVQGNGYPSKLEFVKGRMEINVNFSVTLQLDAAKVTAGGGERLPLTPPVEKGDTLEINKGYLFPEPRMGKPDARFAMQSFLLPPGGGDTLEFRRAIVMDGKDYHETQLRRMGYKGTRDPLYEIADKSPVLTDSTNKAFISDKIVRNAKNKRVLIMAKLWFEDYNHVYFTDTLEVADTRRVVRPMQFLEYSLESASLDPNSPYYKKTPIRHNMDGDMELPIKFAVGKAMVDPKDSMSMVYLDSLRNVVYGVTHTQGSTLKGYSIYGVASPEGTYAKNVSLAQERMKYIEREVNSMIPSYAKDHMRRPVTESRVATWAELADTLAKDTSMVAYANDIREIVEEYPGSLDRQGAKIRQLPYYNTVIKENLGRLRIVSFHYTQTVMRVLTVDEILDRFRNYPEFQKGGAEEQFTPHEFWVLAQHLRDTTELEKACRRAIAQDVRTHPKKEQRWVYPANVLAKSYLDRDKVDTTILAPYIDESWMKCNQPYHVGENTFLLNPAPVVANQVMMMLKGEHFTRAMQLALLFKGDPDYDQLYAIARCKAGYFDSTTDEGRRYYEMVRSTSPRNAVVMDIAMGYLFEIDSMLDSLDQEDPVTDYLRAQYECIKHFDETRDDSFNLMEEESKTTAIRYLVSSFNKDKKLLATAEQDWYIFKGLYEDGVKEYKEPGSVLPPEVEEPAAMSQEEIDRIMQLGNNGEFDKMTDEEQDLYFKMIYG